jgi:HK97 family phage major capsid protein
MDKHFIPFSGASAKQKSKHAAKITSRRQRLMPFLSAAFKSDGNDDDPNLTPEQKEARKVLREQVRAQVKQELIDGGFISKTEMENQMQERMKPFAGLTPEKIKEFNEGKKAVEDELAEQKRAMKEQGLILQELKNKQLEAIPDRKTIADQIRAALTKDDATKARWEAFKSHQSNSFGTDSKGNAEVEIRAAVTMTVGGSTNASAFVPTPEVMPGFVDLARNQPFLENYANTSNTNSPRIVWTEKYNPQGNAAFIGEGVVKPLISFEVRTLESYAKKVADKIKVSTEMLEDIDFMAAEIESELRYKVDMAVDASLLIGAGDGSNGATDLKGLTSYLGGYVLTTIATTTPNNFDAIRAAAAQVVSLNFNPNIVFINTIDAANMDLVKDTQGRPLAAVYKDAAGKVYRLTVVETNQMPVGYFLLGDMTRFKVRNYKPFAISYGWVNDDFEKNLVTIIGERRLHAFVAANDTGAFVYDTFANVKTAITA